MPDLPKVAVIIANRNHSDYIAVAAASASRQLYEGEVQIFIVDDGSTDTSVSRIVNHFFANEDENLYLIHFIELDKNPELSDRKGHGPAYARNRGIEYAIKTFDPDVFISLDADDEFLPNKIEESVKEWLKAPDLIGAVYSDYYIVGNDGYKKEEYKPAFSYRHLLSENIVHSCSLFSRKAIEAVGPYDEQFRHATCEDYDLWLRIGSKFVIKHIPKMLMNVRDTGLNSSKITDKNRQIWQDSMKYLREKHGKKLHS